MSRLRAQRTRSSNGHVRRTTSRASLALSAMVPEQTPTVARSPAYRHVEELIAAERCVVLDGGIATELQRLRTLKGEPEPGPELWGTWALYRAPHEVLEVHSRYVAAGCHV